MTVTSTDSGFGVDGEAVGTGATLSRTETANGAESETITKNTGADTHGPYLIDILPDLYVVGHLGDDGWQLPLRSLSTTAPVASSETDPTLSFYLFNPDGSYVDLSGSPTVTFEVSDAGGLFAWQKSVTIITATSGYVRCSLVSTTAPAGRYLARFRVSFSSGRRLSVPTFPLELTVLGP